jgi:hypothetical protein
VNYATVQIVQLKYGIVIHLRFEIGGEERHVCTGILEPHVIFSDRKVFWETMREVVHHLGYHVFFNMGHNGSTGDWDNSLERNGLS